MLSGERVIDGFRVRLFTMGELVIGVPSEIGPRILYLAHRDRSDSNLFAILPSLGVETPDGYWRIYGGHRLWTAPEDLPRTYSLDDKPVDLHVEPGRITIRGNPEERNSVQKEIIVEEDPSGGVRVIHRVRNIGRWPIRFSCWALSVMRPGGFAVIPFKPRRVDKHGLLPDRRIAIWPYTDPSDKRLTLAREYILVKQDPGADKPLKIGVNAHPHWAAYWVDGLLFIKRFNVEEGAEYPDHGSYVEVYTNSSMLELETLGPLKIVEPGGVLEHIELWRVRLTGYIDASVDSVKNKVEPLIEGAP